MSKFWKMIAGCPGRRAPCRCDEDAMKALAREVAACTVKEFEATLRDMLEDHGEVVTEPLRRYIDELSSLAKTESIIATNALVLSVEYRAIIASLMEVAPERLNEQVNREMLRIEDIEAEMNALKAELDKRVISIQNLFTPVQD